MEEFDFSKELKRQLVHLSGSVLAGVYLLLGRSPTLTLSLLGLTAALFIYISYRRGREVLSPIMTSLERKEALKKSPARGAVFYFLGISLAILLFPPYITPAVIIITTVGDAFSTLVGLKFGSIKLPYNKDKSLQGSLAFLGSAFVATSLIISPALAFTGSIMGAVAESLIDKRDEDNIAVPLFAGVSMKLIICSGVI